MQRLWAAIEDLGATPEETPEERERRRLQLGMAAGSILIVGLWGLSFVVMGHASLGFVTWLYCAATALMLGLVALTRRFTWFRSAHLLVVLVAPFLFHLELGGFRASGGAFLWSLVVPMAAMMFYGNWRRSIPWLVATLALVIVVGALRESLWATNDFLLTPTEISIQFLLNVSLFIGFVFASTLTFVSRLDRERKRADRLLLNILPVPIAEQLKRRRRTIADRLESVTVLFSDIVGFTQLSAKLSPEELVRVLDQIFSAFDDIADQHGLEKIKTIGDAYMVVGGLPEPVDNHATRIADAALAMSARLAELEKGFGLGLSMRVGIHSGEVVAGVIGRRKFSYDLWGDTVNTASRMESHGAPGRIQVSDVTRQLLGSDFSCEERGLVTVKGKGEMKTHWLNGRAARAVVNPP